MKEKEELLKNHKICVQYVIDTTIYCGYNERYMRRKQGGEEGCRRLELQEAKHIQR